MSGGFEMPHQTSKRKKQGFGGGKAKKPPQQGKTLTTGEAVARHMLLEYNAIKADGGKVARVHARLKDTDEWFPIGNVSANQQYLKRPFLSLWLFWMSDRPGSRHRTRMKERANRSPSRLFVVLYVRIWYKRCGVCAARMEQTGTAV